MNAPPCVLVLLATHNGLAWLPEQLDTLLGQRGCQLRILACDDASNDGTLDLLRSRANGMPQFRVLTNVQRFGSAGKNFYHLIEQADLGDAQYVAFADQDDHWLPDKLQRAIQELRRTGASAYSSNFLAWYPHLQELRRLVRKSQRQRAWDYLFQGPGPGCTFVLTREYFVALRDFMSSHRSQLPSIVHHDWLIYAHARSTQRVWHIDEATPMLYRQHAHNEIGASVGSTAALKRLRMIRSGWLRDQVLAIAEITGLGQSWPAIAMRRLSFSDRLKLAWNVCELRRGWRDRVALALALVFLISKKSV